MGSLIGIIALVICWSLSQRVKKLEKQVHDLKVIEVENPAIMSNNVAPAVGVQAVTAVPAAVSQSSESFANQVSAGDSIGDQFVNWIKEDFLVKVGAGLLLLAFGWFVSYAFANNWIGPAGRIALGLILSSLFMILGAVRINTRAHQGGIFVSLGATGVLLTLFAARNLYDMFTPASALTLSFAVAIFVAFVSVRYQRSSLAYTGLVLGSIAPLLVNVSHPDPLMFFLYLLLVASGTLWVVWITGWTGLILSSLIITFGYSLTYLLDSVGNNDVAIMFSFLFVTLYYGANMVSLVRRHGKGTHHIRIHAYTALGTAFFLFAWIQTGIPEEWRSLVYVAWSLVFGLGTYVVYNFTANLPAFYLYGGTSAALIGLATAAELDGLLLVVAFLFEILGVTLAAVAITRAPRIPATISWLLLLPLLLSLPSLEYYRWDSVIGLDFFVLLLTIIVLTVSAIMIRAVATAESLKDELVSTTLTILTVAAGGYAAVTLWNVLHAGMASGAATIISLVIYTVVGIGLLIQGRAQNHQVMKWSGAALVGFVVVRLLIVEVWNMPIEIRIVAFLVIGILLISTAFMGKRVMKDHE